MWVAGHLYGPAHASTHTAAPKGASTRWPMISCALSNNELRFVDAHRDNTTHREFVDSTWDFVERHTEQNVSVVGYRV